MCSGQLLLILLKKFIWVEIIHSQKKLRIMIDSFNHNTELFWLCLKNSLIFLTTTYNLQWFCDKIIKISLENTIITDKNSEFAIFLT